MSRLFTASRTANQPAIDPGTVLEFFEQRARKVSQLGYDRAVIYQDNNPELAQSRDQAEKSLLLPKLALTGQERTLDIGCGTGRWANVLGPASGYYHGIDVSPSLVQVARQRFAGAPKMTFSVLGAADLSLQALHEPEPFDRICCIGTLMYLNDTVLRQTLKGIANTLAPGGLFLLREPIGIGRRLTLSEHFSEEMQQNYNAIYRTEEELLDYTSEVLAPAGFELLGQGDVYANAALNNRKETKQHWFLFRCQP